MTYARDIHNQEIIDDLEHRNRMQRIQLDQALKTAENLSKPNEGLFDRIDVLNREIKKHEAVIAQKEKLILEWMHTNAAFKKLAKDFADQLGIPKEERPQLVDQARVDVAEADPAFKHTDIYKDAVESLQKTKIKP